MAAMSERLRPLKYQAHEPFFTEIRTSVERYFELEGKVKHGGGRILIKTVWITLWWAASWSYLVFASSTWWEALLSGTSLAFAMAAVGFNIQHDGGHRAFSGSRRVNRGFAFAMDMVGASSYLWHHKHNLMHHHHTNVDGMDEDIDAAPFLRLAPSQERKWFHRFQHFYAWPLYGFLTTKWFLFDDFKNAIVGCIGDHPIPRPKGTELFLFLLGKVIFFGWALAIPFAVHSWPMVILGYLAVSTLLGAVLSLVFQLAHCVEETTFWVPPEEGQKMESSWAAHQIATTANFAPGSKLLTWYLGGLNYQVEHHLFPHVSHIHYPNLSPLVARACENHGVEYRSVPTFGRALRSHFRFLRGLSAA